MEKNESLERLTNIVADFTSLVGKRLPDDVTAKLKELADGRYAVIYITEALAAQIPDAVDLYREKQIPAVILIPGVAGNTGAGIAQVKKSVERAVGSDIIFGTE